MDETSMWLLAIAVTVAIAFLGIWWKVESRQDKSLCALRRENDASHKVMYAQIDKVKDKIEKIWIHLVEKDK